MDQGKISGVTGQIIINFVQIINFRNFQSVIGIIILKTRHDLRKMIRSHGGDGCQTDDFVGLFINLKKIIVKILSDADQLLGIGQEEFPEFAELHRPCGAVE